MIQHRLTQLRLTRRRGALSLLSLALAACLGCGESASNQGAGATPSSSSTAADATTAQGSPSAQGSPTAQGSPSTGSSTETAPAGAEVAATGCGALPIEDGFVDVPATDPGIRYVGRFDAAQPSAPRMAFPASTIETEFEGDAIDLRLEELAPGTSATTTQYYEVSIDGAAPSKLETCPEQAIYALARGLAPGSHSVRISKRTEGSVGAAAFLGFRVRPNTTLNLPEAPARRMEFVGDSITCGYGNEVSTTDPDSFKFTSTNQNALSAYGALSARALGADYVAVAASGRGMVRNYDGGGGLHAPEFYALSGPDASAAPWDHARYSPDVIVINLGTNDFSIGLDADELLSMREEYRATYAEFLTQLRGLHPAATLIAAVGPMMSDSYPPDYQAWTSIRADVEQIVAGFVSAGDARVLYFEFAPQASPYGEDWHPTTATHQGMADALSAFVQSELGW